MGVGLRIRQGLLAAKLDEMKKGMKKRTNM